MRRNFFKREIKSIIREHDLNATQEMDLLEALFEGVKTDVSEQYLLKNEIKNEQHFQGARPKSIDEKAFFAVKDLIFVKSDLYLPASISSSIEAKEPIALFIGSGVSKLIGLPLWNELASDAIEHLFIEERISFNEYERLKAGFSPKSVLSIFHQSFSVDERKRFYKVRFKKNGNPNPYELIASLNIPKVSLNLDDYLWTAMELQNNKLFFEDTENDITKVLQQFQRECFSFNDETPIENNYLYQIHGSYQTLEKHSIITMRDYLTNYYQSNKGLPAFLRKLSANYKLIFLGCGMEEMELLGPILSAGKRHVVVVGTYIGEKRFHEIQRKYFKDLNMDVHGYYLDFNGYDRLYELIKVWIKEIGKPLYSKLSEIDDVTL